MRRIVIRSPGGYDRLELQEAPDPQPSRGEVRIAVRHIGVNYADVVIRMGLYASAKKLVGWPITPGFEVAGVVDAVGEEVDDLAIGQAVIGITLFNGYSSSLVLPRRQVFRRPAGMRSEDAAGIPTVFLTAWFALHELAHVRAGEAVLIHSAAGGVGSAAVQLAARAGANAVAVVGAANKQELPRSLGAREVAVKSQEDWRAAADRISPAGYDVILDANGAETLAESYRRLAPLGRLVVYGFHTMLPRSGAGASGKPSWVKLARDYLRTPRFNPLELTTQNRSVMGFNLSFLSARSDLMIPAMEQILGAFAAGDLKSPPVTIHPLADVARAHRELESGQTQGKLVLQV